MKEDVDIASRRRTFDGWRPAVNSVGSISRVSLASKGDGPCFVPCNSAPDVFVQALYTGETGPCRALVPSFDHASKPKPTITSSPHQMGVEGIDCLA